MHNKKQKLTFFLLIDKYIDENLFLPKIIDKLKEDVSYDVRNHIKRKVESTDINEDKNTIKILALFYCLHIQKPKHGHMSMFTKHLIKDTDIDFDPKNITELNKKIHQMIIDVGLPDLTDTHQRFIENVYYYKPDFINQYPDLNPKQDS